MYVLSYYMNFVGHWPYLYTLLYYYVRMYAHAGAYVLLAVCRSMAYAAWRCCRSVPMSQINARLFETNLMP